MANTLIEDLQWIQNYLTENPLERPFLDDKVREVLARHYAALGWTSQIQFIEDLNAQPVLTFVKAALHMVD